MELDRISFASRDFCKRNGECDRISRTHFIQISIFDEKGITLNMVSVVSVKNPERSSQTGLDGASGSGKSFADNSGSAFMIRESEFADVAQLLWMEFPS
jgi:hypothetical protein